MSLGDQLRDAAGEAQRQDREEERREVEQLREDADLRGPECDREDLGGDDRAKQAGERREAEDARRLDERREVESPVTRRRGGAQLRRQPREGVEPRAPRR